MPKSKNRIDFASLSIRNDRILERICIRWLFWKSSSRFVFQDILSSSQYSPVLKVVKSIMELPAEKTFTILSELW